LWTDQTAVSCTRCT